MPEEDLKTRVNNLLVEGGRSRSSSSFTVANRLNVPEDLILALVKDNPDCYSLFGTSGYQQIEIKSGYLKQREEELRALVPPKFREELDEFLSDTRYKSRSVETLSAETGVPREVILIFVEDHKELYSTTRSSTTSGPYPDTVFVKKVGSTDTREAARAEPEKVGAEEFKAKIEGSLSLKKYLYRSVDSLAREIAEEPSEVLHYLRENPDTYTVSIFKEEIYAGMKEKIDAALKEKEDKLEAAMKAEKETTGPKAKADLKPIRGERKAKIPWIDIAADLGLAYIHLHRVFRRLPPSDEKISIGEIVRLLETVEESVRKEERKEGKTSNVIQMEGQCTCSGSTGTAFSQVSNSRMTPYRGGTAGPPWGPGY